MSQPRFIVMTFPCLALVLLLHTLLPICNGLSVVDLINLSETEVMTKRVCTKALESVWQSQKWTQRAIGEFWKELLTTIFMQDQLILIIGAVRSLLDVQEVFKASKLDSYCPLNG
ncbi:hypothetical protein JHK82_021026 [Glycine max]|nr:hypothetical protein JHK85_021475 [Glycine max]KAG5136295.1 hypothetical protein JHK82_021026 [Glycine max]KAH1236738.1 hypothetical protein GmHk_08G021873 [Glycine max]